MQTLSTSEHLSLWVETRNALNEKAMQAQYDLREIFIPYLGKKLFKTSGDCGLIAKVKSDYDEWSSNLSSEGYRAFIDKGYHWLYLEIDCTFKVSECAVEYVKNTITIGRVTDDGYLDSLDEVVKLRTDYTAEWVQQTQDKAYQLECEARELRRSLHDFRR